MTRLRPLLRCPAAALLAASLCATAGCVATALDASSGDYGAQAEMYLKDSALGPDGRLVDPAGAEHWLQQMAQQRVEYHDLYALALMDGRFGHIDEAKALTEARAGLQSSAVAQGILDTVAKLEASEAKDFPAWQRLYAETRPLCPDRYPGPASALDTTLAAARGSGRYDLLPDAIQPGMANVHAYLKFVQNCPFTLVEQLDDPHVYAVYADWYDGPIVAEPKKAAALRALAHARFPDAGTPAVAADEESLGAVRGDILLRYFPLYTPQLQDADTEVKAECAESLLPINDALREKRYTDLVTLADQAAKSTCSSGYERAVADRFAVAGLSHGGQEIAAIVRGLALLKNDTYDADIEKSVIADMFLSMEAQGSWTALDDLVATLKARYPAIQTLKL